MKREEFYTRVYQVVKVMPPGKVATYGKIAWIIGTPQCAVTWLKALIKEAAMKKSHILVQQFSDVPCIYS